MPDDFNEIEEKIISLLVDTTEGSRRLELEIKALNILMSIMSNEYYITLRKEHEHLLRSYLIALIAILRNSKILLEIGKPVNKDDSDILAFISNELTCLLQVMSS